MNNTDLMNLYALRATQIILEGLEKSLERERTEEYPYGDTIEPHDVAVEEELLLNLD